MGRWTVYKVRSLHNGGAGQSLEKLGMVEAPSFNAARLLALAEYAHQADMDLPGRGITIVEACGQLAI
ncbi:MAG: hypothetical protein DMF06_04995 [Verrucomicrobia bacterium]|nr:MAG: hypothetical protein DMF06_04995 [Verrucomicrobiota bacterium]